MKMILVLDNAAYHHSRGIPALSSINTKPKVLELLRKHEVGTLKLDMHEHREAACAELREKSEDGTITVMEQDILNRVSEDGDYIQLAVPAEDDEEGIQSMLSRTTKNKCLTVPGLDDMKNGFLRWVEEEKPELLECKLKNLVTEAYNEDPASPDSGPDTPAFEVASIVAKKTDDDGKIKLKVRWKGYTCTDDTWEPLTELWRNARVKVREFDPDLDGAVEGVEGVEGATDMYRPPGHYPGGYILWTPAYCFDLQPIETYWAQGKNEAADKWEHGRTMKTCIEHLRRGWYGDGDMRPDAVLGADVKKAVNCAGLIAKVHRTGYNKRIVAAEDLDGTIDRIIVGEAVAALDLTVDITSDVMFTTAQPELFSTDVGASCTPRVFKCSPQVTVVTNMPV